MSNDNYSLNNIMSKLSNPLDDRDLLQAILNKKLEEGNSGTSKYGFDIRRLKVPETVEPDDNGKYYRKGEFVRFQVDLMKFILKEYYYRLANDRSRLNYENEDLRITSPIDVNIVKRLSEAPDEIIQILIEDLDKFQSFDSSNYHEFIENARNRYGASEKLWYILSICYNRMVDLPDHAGKAGHGSIFNNALKDKTLVRLYLNTPRDKGLLDFASAYIKECINEGIEFDCKMGANILGYDKTVLYSTLRDLPKRVKILEKIARENSDLIRRFGTPSPSCAKLNDSYYGISHIGVTNENSGYNTLATYNDYIDGVCDTAFTLLKCRLLWNRAIFDKNGVTPEEFDMLQNVSLLRNFSDSTIFGGTGRQVVRSTQYMESQNDGISKGISWDDIDKKIKGIMGRYPEYVININSKIRSGEINIVEDFRTAMLDVSDFAQGREKSEEDSNIAISLAMEKEAKRLSKDEYSL